MFSGPAAEFFLSFFSTFWMTIGEKLLSSRVPLMTGIEMVSIAVKRPRPTRSTMHVTKVIFILLNSHVDDSESPPAASFLSILG